MEFGKLGLTLALTKRQVGIGIGLGIGCVTLLGLGLLTAYPQRQGKMALDQSDRPETIATASTSSNSALSQATPDDQALLRSLPQWDSKVSTPETIGFTNPDDRLRQVKVGRSDPFAPTETLLVNVGSEGNAPSQAPSKDPGLQFPPPPTELLFLPQAPSVSVSDVSALPVVAESAGIAPLPSANSAPLSPTHLADQMEIKGVLEFENQWQAIVREPESTQSKTVRAGDALAGGQVKVRRIERSRNGVLQIVLEQNGIEVIRPMS